jgi:hypothetical protein
MRDTSFGIDPLHIVAYDDGTVVRYTIEHRLDGTVCCARDNGTGVVAPRQWDRVTYAYQWLARPDSSWGFTTVWVEARPVFGDDGWLVLPDQQVPAEPPTPHQEYQRALEMDVG